MCVCVCFVSMVWIKFKHHPGPENMKERVCVLYLCIYVSMYACVYGPENKCVCVFCIYGVDQIQASSGS